MWCSSRADTCLVPVTARPAGERQVKQSKIIGGGSWLDEKSAKSQGQIGPQVDTAV